MRPYISWYKPGLIHKKLYKNGITCLMTRGFDIFNVSGVKYRVTYRKNCLIWWNLITFCKLSTGRKHLWVSMISNFKFRIFKSNYHFSLFNYNLNKTCSVPIFNFAVLWNFMSDSPILLPWSFYPHTICTLMVVNVNTSYGT